VAKPNYKLQITNYLLPLLVAATVFERFNIFIESLDFSLKLSLILLPIVGLILLVRKKIRFNPTFLFPFLAAFLVAEVFSIAFSYDRAQSFQVVVFYLLMIGLFYLFVWAIRRMKDLELSVMAWGVGALVISLFGFWQFGRYFAGQSPTIFLDSILEAKSLPPETFTQALFGQTFLRPSSTFIDTNTAASFVGTAIILGLAFLLVSRGRWRRVFFSAVIVFSAVFSVMSLSRSAVIGLAVGLAVFVLLSFWGRIRKGVLVGSAITFLAIILVGVTFFSVTHEERMESSLNRADYLCGAAAMFEENPLLGIGAGNFESYYTEVIAPDEEFGYSHSILLTWLGETGLFGLLANLFLAAVVTWALVREALRWKSGSRWRVLLSGLAAAFLALVAANIFHAHYGLEFTWVLLGLCVSGYYLARKSGVRSQESVDILGIRVDNVTMGEAIDRVKQFFRSGKRAYVVTPNSEMVMATRSDREFRKILNKADLAIPDGAGPVWASRILGTPLTEWVAGRKLFVKLCAEAARRGGRVFLLGGEEGVAEKTAKALKNKYSKLRIVGTFAGDGSPKGDKESVAAVRSAVRQTKQPNNRITGQPIDLLFVAYGHGKQEKWIARNLKKVPVKVAMGVGGAFDFVAGEGPGVPKFIERLGLEWLYRLIRQPWRLRRQLALIPFIFLSFKESFRRL
jgi:N-acetylglucosaminyldiphosphoundecaprenol N-acetyl-beta-D-mannosaminyltransferase